MSWKSHVHRLLCFVLLSPVACQFELEKEKSQATEPAPVDSGPPPPDPDNFLANAPPPPPAGTEPFRGLIVRDPAIVDGALASNALDTGLSFRAMIEWLVGDKERALPATREWLGQWETVTKVGPYGAPVAPRPQIDPLLIAPWFASQPPASTPGTGAYDEPTRTDTSLWNRAPFRLLAVVNRLDLAADPCQGPPGKIHLVYAVLDASLRAPLEMTIVLEVPYPETRSAAAWARLWERLPSQRDSRYPTLLGLLVSSVLHDAAPYGARLRSNELALGGGVDKSWELREFHVEDGPFGRQLLMNTLESTPRDDVDPKSLATHIVQNAEEIGAHAVPLPEAMQGGAARTPRAGFSWAVPGVDDSLRTAFSRQTCNGCHGGDTATLPFQHIAADPSRDAPARLSRFLSDPSGPTDELRRRQRRFEALLASECANDPTPPSYEGTR